ncbi:hypothetical protein VB779_08610 [Haloarculaceae archaeon H-GB11]|nr:hypothetical protein [Haloarculaceae archaeon H-GB11]
MSKNQRRARDALVGLLVALAPFAYKQFLAGNQYVAGVTLALMAGLGLVYRYADARAMEAVAEGDVDELKPVLRRVGRRLRKRVKSRS